MELGKAIHLFLGEQTKSSTRQAYSTALVPLRDWCGPSRELSGIKPELVIEYFQECVQSKSWAVATQFKHAKTIKTFFNWCVRLDLLVKSPALALRARKPSRYISREKAISDSELALVLDYLRYKTNPRDYALVLFLADTGCRRGGAAGLRIQDVNLDRLIATVTEKGDKTRTVAFSARCAKAILHWLAYRSVHYVVKGVYVFTQHGEKNDPENISRIVRRACIRVGARSLGAHSLRHRKGHQLEDNDVHPAIAATVMGHESVQTYMDNYTHGDWESAEAAARKLMTDPQKLPRVVNFPDPD
jgi:integrase